MADVLVVGGGIVGLLTSHALHLRGVQVKVFDTPSVRPGASWAGGGILSALYPWRYADEVSCLTLPALAAYRELAQIVQEIGGVDPEVRVPGMLVFGEPDIALALNWARQHGVRLEEQHGRLWLPDIGSVRNPRMLKGLRLLLRRHNIEQLNEAVSKVVAVPGGGWEVHTATAVHRGSKVLVSAGYWSAALLGALGIRLDICPVKGQMLLYQLPDRRAPEQILLTPEGYLIPRDGHTVVVGSTLERGVVDQRPSQSAHRQLQDVAVTLWPALARQAPIAQWAGIRPGTSRQAPILSEAPHHPGLFVATGHYRNGLVCAPASAEIMAALIMGETPAIDPAPYSLSPSSSSPP